jgi:anthranilate 1,2-dioxygenase small subunit
MNKIASRGSEQLDPALREILEDLIFNYAYALDDEDIDRWPQFFTESGLYHLTTKENYDAGLPIGIMRCVGRGMMSDRVKAFHTANIFEPHSYNHIVNRPLLAMGATQGAYSARSNFQVTRIMQDGRAEPFATGRYLDVIVVEKGVAKFQERVVVLDSRQIDILMVVPI